MGVLETIDRKVDEATYRYLLNLAQIDLDELGEMRGASYQPGSQDYDFKTGTGHLDWFQVDYARTRIEACREFLAVLGFDVYFDWKSRLWYTGDRYGTIQHCVPTAA